MKLAYLGGRFSEFDIPKVPVTKVRRFGSLLLLLFPSFGNGVIFEKEYWLIESGCRDFNQFFPNREVCRSLKMC
jgi:hypothetical protein